MSRLELYAFLVSRYVTWLILVSPDALKRGLEGIASVDSSFLMSNALLESDR